jgi:hypothetical protein
MPLTYGSRYGFGCGSGSCYFRHWLQDANKKLKQKKFSAYYFLKVHFHHFSKIKNSKRSHRIVGIKVFLTIFAWWWKSGSASIPLTNGSGSGSRRPKNIRIRILIRIRNTGKNHAAHTGFPSAGPSLPYRKLIGPRDSLEGKDAKIHVAASRQLIALTVSQNGMVLERRIFQSEMEFIMLKGYIFIRHF